MNYINTTHIKKLVKEISPSKRIGKDFLFLLDIHIESLIKKAVTVHNGSKKTIDRDVAAYLGLK